MINKIHLTPNKDFQDVIFEWDSGIDDYVVTQIPVGLTRLELMDTIEEILYITRWDEE